jgi:hypothetical protein
MRDESSSAAVRSRATMAEKHSCFAVIVLFDRVVFSMLESPFQFACLRLLALFRYIFKSRLSTENLYQTGNSSLKSSLPASFPYSVPSRVSNLHKSASNLLTNVAMAVPNL